MRPDAPLGLFDLTPEALGERMAGHGEAPYRAGQIIEWVYRRGATSFDDMSNLPKALRGRLAESLPIYNSNLVRKSDAKDGVIKLLLGWPDGASSECVLIPDDRRRTACISTQVGCPVGCGFCASGLDGLDRHLTAGEIVEQAMRIRQLCGPSDRLSNVVFMGLGEPLANYDATLAAVRTINADWGMNIAARKITISTVGLPKAIERLADEGLQITLAISLHAPNDDLRRRIIPWAKSIRLQHLIDAANRYFHKTSREVTLEYILLGGLNDAPQHARQLAGVARKMRSNVNLIRYNPVKTLPYQRPTAQSSQAFLQVLRQAGVNAHLRRSRGLTVDAACGQLRRRDQLCPEDALHVSEKTRFPQRG